MAEQFDPYLQWLGIRNPERPPNHYLLLGVSPFEDDPDVLNNAADRQMAHVRTFQTGPHSAESQQLLNELATAKICLLNRDKKSAYDTELQRRICIEPPAPPVEPPSSVRLEPPVAAPSPSSNVYLETPVFIQPHRRKPHRSSRRKSTSVAWTAVLWGVLTLLIMGLAYYLYTNGDIRLFLQSPQEPRPGPAATDHNGGK